jgi:TonB family protein
MLMFRARILTAALFLAPALEAQTIAGVVLDRRSQQPLVGITVHARDVVAGTDVPGVRTDTSGVFYIHLAAGGTFHISFQVDSLTRMAGDTVRVAAGDLIERRYLIDGGEPTYLESQVEKPVGVRPGNRAPHYPDALRRVNMQGAALMQFVVDTNGRVDPTSIKALTSSHELFTKAATEALLRLTFHPAEIGGRPVRQVVQQPFNFCLRRLPGPC